MSETLTGQLTAKELRELRRLKMVREALDRLKRKGITADMPICPLCKSPRLIDLTSAHDLGIFPGSFQPAFYCLDCGWYGRIALVMSNRPQRDAVLEDLHEAFADMRENTIEIEDSVDEDF